MEEPRAGRPRPEGPAAVGLDSVVALDTAALTKEGANNVTKVVQAIDARVPGTVRRPKRKGEGYFIRVRSKLAVQQPLDITNKRF